MHEQLSIHSGIVEFGGLLDYLACRVCAIRNTVLL